MNKFAQQGVSLSQAIEELKTIKNSPDDAKFHVIENLCSNVQSPQISMKLMEIKGSLQANGEITTIDPISGKKYPNANSKIDELISYLHELERAGEKQKMSDNSFNFKKFAQEKQNEKKKSRGNPFRVLMGKIGKLLDHGLEKKEIVRYLKKENIWDEKTIDKAVGIVKEYNKKKHRKNKKEVEASTLPNTAEDWGRVKKDYSKRSTPELITSICWLNSLAKIDPKKTSFAKEVADRSGVKTMIREIRAELLKRDMSEQVLDFMMK